MPQSCPQGDWETDWKNFSNLVAFWDAVRTAYGKAFGEALCEEILSTKPQKAIQQASQKANIEALFSSKININRNPQSLPFGDSRFLKILKWFCIGLHVSWLLKNASIIRNTENLHFFYSIFVTKSFLTFFFWCFSSLRPFSFLCLCA